jgi:hypothetical protein
MLDRRIKSGDDGGVQHAYAGIIGELKIYPRSKILNYISPALLIEGVVDRDV